MIKSFASLLLPRFLRFRKEVFMLWKAFWAPGTPLYLKAGTLLALAYLVSPIDLLPDFIPLAGWIDDIIIVPLIVSWVASRLSTRTAPAQSSGPTINGTARRV